MAFQARRLVCGEARRPDRAGPLGDKRSGQRARLCWPRGCVWEAELHPEGSGVPVEGSELGVMRWTGGRSEGNRNRSTETLERGASSQRLPRRGGDVLA